jgi:hypothetical protein
VFEPVMRVVVEVVICDRSGAKRRRVLRLHSAAASLRSGCQDWKADFLSFRLRFHSAVGEHLRKTFLCLSKPSP